MPEAKPKAKLYPAYRYLGIQDYFTTWQNMRQFTLNCHIEQKHHQPNYRLITEPADKRADNEVWFTEHPPVFTLGSSGQTKHLLQSTNIPLIKTDRGGQITYHGPGQLLVYCLFNLQQLQLGVSQLVRLLEQLILLVLERHQITGHLIKGAPGVYIQGKKVASIGLKISHGRCYHGFALNIDMDLMPFSLINPCGYSGLEVTDMKTWMQTANLKVQASHASIAPESPHHPQYQHKKPENKLALSITQTIKRLLNQLLITD